MAPKHNFRPSGARVTLIAFIAVVSIVALMTTAVSAQCECTVGNIFLSGAKGYPSLYSTRYVTLPISSIRNSILCQRRGTCRFGNCWWDKIYYGGSYFYVNDYYVYTGCANRCTNKPLCY